MDIAFRANDDHIFMDGWFVGSTGPITSVKVRNTDGTESPLAFRAFYFKRRDVIDAFRDKAPESRCVGYRMLIDVSELEAAPSSVTIEMRGGDSFVQSFKDRYTTALMRDWKIQRLTATPDSFGLARPLDSDPLYAATILEHAKPSIISRATNEAFIDTWYQHEDGTLILLGWIDDDATVRGQCDVIWQTTTDGGRHGFVFRYLRPDLSKDTQKPLGGVFITKNPQIEYPCQLKFHCPSVGDVTIGNDGNKIGQKEIVDHLLNKYEECRQAGLSPTENTHFGRLVTPLIESVYAKQQKSSIVAEDIQIGTMVSEPSTSIVIPIYKSYELLRNQLADFATDSFLIKQEIILVLDSPEDKERFRLWIDRLHALYSIPVRLLIMSQNVGFARACNAGASFASGPYLLFLNSDVFPKHFGWLESMLRKIDGDDSIGVVGAQLLYPDGSIQHAGISWRRAAGLQNQLINIHPWKGMDPALIPAGGAAEVAAVSAACLLCRTDDFRALGMFDEGYIRGDYEDTDFCLKMRESGKKVICDHDISLYHVEGNSYPSADRRRVFFFNAMRHELRWGSVIEQLKDDYSGLGK